MTEKTWHEIIKDTFITTLECAKEIEPGTHEWDFVWSALHTFKEYAEKREERERKKAKPPNTEI